MQTFHDRLKSEIHQSSYDYKSLSLAIGQGERYISNMLSGRSDPGFSNVIKMCAVLKLTPNQMAGLHCQINVDPDTTSACTTSRLDLQLGEALQSMMKERRSCHGDMILIDDLITWWHTQKGKLAHFEWLADHVEIYHAPEPDIQMPDPAHVGPLSYAAQVLGSTTAAELTALLDRFDVRVSKFIGIDALPDHLEGPELSIQEVTLSAPDQNTPLTFHFKQILLPVTDPRGVRYIISFKQPV